MQMERRAFYNLLRMNSLLDPSLPVEPWQIEDYRLLSTEELFSRLKPFHIDIGKAYFLALAEQFSSPEELSDSFVPEEEDDIAVKDQIYLVIFELWRRLLTQVPVLSVFCDELDHQIYLYDSGLTEDSEAMQDVLGRFRELLEESVDAGAEQAEAFECICAGCANEVESFLYDFIAEQIDNEGCSYAQELLDSFTAYVKDPKWFEFLKVRLLAATDDDGGADAMLRRLIQEAVAEPDLEFNFEVLSFLVEEGEYEVFINLVKQSLLLLEREEEFQELLTICVDYYHRLDQEQKEAAVQAILEGRFVYSIYDAVDQADPALAELVAILAAPTTP